MFGEWLIFLSMLIVANVYCVLKIRLRKASKRIFYIFINMESFEREIIFERKRIFIFIAVYYYLNRGLNNDGIIHAIHCRLW